MYRDKTLLIFRRHYYPTLTLTLYLLTGDHDLNTNDGFEQNIPIQRIISHPQYVGQINNHDYDLALIKHQRPLVYNNRVRPVCLPELNFPANTNCYVTGWGATSEGSPQVLIETSVTGKTFI